MTVSKSFGHRGPFGYSRLDRFVIENTKSKLPWRWEIIFFRKAS